MSALSKSMTARISKFPLIMVVRVQKLATSTKAGNQAGRQRGRISSGFLIFAEQLKMITGASNCSV